jgi:hypothetical protein
MHIERCFSLELKLPERETEDFLPPSSDKDRNMWSFASASRIGLHVVLDVRDNLPLRCN